MHCSSATWCLHYAAKLTGCVHLADRLMTNEKTQPTQLLTYAFAIVGLRIRKALLPLPLAV